MRLSDFIEQGPGRDNRKGTYKEQFEKNAPLRMRDAVLYGKPQEAMMYGKSTTSASLGVSALRLHTAAATAETSPDPERGLFILALASAIMCPEVLAVWLMEKTYDKLSEADKAAQQAAKEQQIFHDQMEELGNDIHAELHDSPIPEAGSLDLPQGPDGSQSSIVSNGNGGNGFGGGGFGSGDGNDTSGGETTTSDLGGDSYA